tara:strand:+ start:388 stop:1005 length:618 start_codon:yes stop_codon:yes gene_type:complete
MPEFKIHNLWPIPIYDSKIPVKQEWKNFVVNLEYDRTHINNSDISKDRYILNNVPELKTEIEKHCEYYVRKYLTVKSNAKFYLMNSWSNIHSPEEQSQVHCHANSILSGVYYPIFPKNSGNLCFHKSYNMKNIIDQNILLDYEEHNNITAQKYVFNIEEGSIVIFPSHLDHSVEKNNSNEKRYSIAFNFYVKGKFGREEYELEIK